MKQRSWGSGLLIILLIFTLSACSEDSVDTMSYPPVLTIATYNVEDFSYNVNNEKNHSDDSTTAYDGVASILKSEGIGIVGLQEVQDGSSKSDTYGDGSISSQGDVAGFNQALAAQNHFMKYFAFSADGGFRRDFIAAWSLYKIEDVTSIKPDTMRDPSTGVVYSGYRPILRFRVRYRGNDIWFYNAHLKSNAGGIIENNMARRRAQAFHLYRYIMRHHNPEKDLIVIFGDMNTMPEDFDGSGNSTIDYLCFKYDNPANTANDFVPVNLKHIGAITNSPVATYNASCPGTTHPGEQGGYPDATFDHIILSPTLYNKYYVQGSVRILKRWDNGSGAERGYADHMPVVLQLQFTNN